MIVSATRVNTALDRVHHAITRVLGVHRPDTVKPLRRVIAAITKRPVTQVDASVLAALQRVREERTAFTTELLAQRFFGHAIAGELVTRMLRSTP